jgi:hypothetical protein
MKIYLVIMLVMMDTVMGYSQATTTVVKPSQFPVASTIGDDDYILANVWSGTKWVTSITKKSKLLDGMASKIDVTNISLTISAATNTYLAWAYAGAFLLTNATYSTDGVLTNGSILWPSGVTGTFLTTNVNTEWTTFDSYLLTIGGTNSIYQPTVSRDLNGNVTNSPAMIYQ